MKIVLCGSRTFIKEIKEISNILEKIGYKTILPPSAMDNKEKCPRIEENKELFLKLKKEYMTEHFKLIENSDTVLVCNFDKNAIKNYIGGNIFVEIMYAWYLGKKIFLLNNILEDETIKEELIAVNPVIVRGIENLKEETFK